MHLGGDLVGDSSGVEGQILGDPVAGRDEIGRGRDQRLDAAQPDAEISEQEHGLDVGSFVEANAHDEFVLSLAEPRQRQPPDGRIDPPAVGFGVQRASVQHDGGAFRLFEGEPGAFARHGLHVDPVPQFDVAGRVGAVWLRTCPRLEHGAAARFQAEAAAEPGIEPEDFLGTLPFGVAAFGIVENPEFGPVEDQDVRFVAHDLPGAFVHRAPFALHQDSMLRQIA